MRTSRYTEGQIIMALQQAKAGTPVAQICRKMEIAEATFYRWKKKYGGLGVPELRELRQLREENRKLKQLVTYLSLDRHILQESPRKKSEVGAEAVVGSVGAGCFSGFPASGLPHHRGSPINRQVPFAPAYSGAAQTSFVKELAAVRVNYGYRRLHVLLWREGWEM